MQAFLGFYVFQTRSFFVDFIDKLVFIAYQKLARGGEIDRFTVVGAALGLHVEIVDGVDLIAPQLDAHGRVAVGHKQVDDAAADGELTAAFDVVAALVAEQNQRLLEFSQVDLNIRFQCAGNGTQDFLGDSILCRRVEGGDDDVIVARKHPAEDVQALMLVFVRLDLRRDVDKIFFRINQRSEPHGADIVAQHLRFLLILGNTKGSDGAFPAERRDDIRFVDARYADGGGAGARSDGVVQRLELLGAPDDLV